MHTKQIHMQSHMNPQQEGNYLQGKQTNKQIKKQSPYQKMTMLALLA
jgi:hypothetical protein